MSQNCYDLNNQYINYIFINNVIHKLNLDLNEIILIDVISDWNCLMRCLPCFVFKDENCYSKIRSDIVDYLQNHKNYYDI